MRQTRKRGSGGHEWPVQQYSDAHVHNEIKGMIRFCMHGHHTFREEIFPFRANTGFVIRVPSQLFLIFVLHQTGVGKLVAIITYLLSLLLFSLHQESTAIHPAAETVEDLGKTLFFDPILSKDKRISCASCHKPAFAFADTVAFSKGVGGAVGARNTPSVMNMAFRPYFFYDGRAATLEQQAIGPIENPVEMHLPYAEAVRRVQGQEGYQRDFRHLYGSAPDSATILHAIATYIRSLESDGSAPFDRWMRNDENAMSQAQIRGRGVFLNKGKCFDCHFSPDFTGDEFRNVGTYDGQTLNDKGRFEVTRDSADIGKFKVPGLRNVALTAPYMHNGMFQTLEEVIDFYDDPYAFVEQPVNMDSLMLEPLGLTDQEKSDLLSFLHALTDTNLPAE